MAAKKKPAGKAAAKIQKAKAQQWTRHRGDKAPVALGVYVEVRLRNGATMHGQAGEFEWRVDGKHHLDIMAWRRVRKPRQPKALPPEAIPAEQPPADADLPLSMTGLSPAAYTDEIRHPVADQLDPTSPNRPSCPITTDWREEEIMRDLTAGRKIGLLLISVIVMAAVGIFLRLQFGG